MNNVPVYDGVLKFHFNKNSELSSLNSNVIEAGNLNTVPTVSKEVAEAIALKMMVHMESDDPKAVLKVNKSTLYVFQKGLVQGYKGPVHLVYEVEVGNGFDIREFLYIDAHNQELVEQFTGIHGIDRKLYTHSWGFYRWEEKDGTSGKVFNDLNPWEKSAVMSSGFIYNLMKNAFGYISWNNRDYPMVAVDNMSPRAVACPMARWAGTYAMFCTGAATDDIVGHEFAHGYTQNTSSLVYAYQPGAINESYSDIWGETVDLLDNYMDEGEDNSLRTMKCTDASTRWKIGEKAISLRVRDMWNPSCMGYPGKVSDPGYVYTSIDKGGVHINSSVLNHLYALLVDGGTYNGQTIRGLGLAKAAHIFWYAQANFMTSTTNFAAQADYLEASLIALRDAGVDLPGLSTTDYCPPTSSGEVIGAADLAELQKAILAVELRGADPLHTTPILKPIQIGCTSGLSGREFFREDFESGWGAWTMEEVPSSKTWVPRNWVLRGGAPGGRGGKVAYAESYKGGDCEKNFQNGFIALTSPEITIPATSTGPYVMDFDHYLALEREYDGGILAYKAGPGKWGPVPATAFTNNGYNSILNATASDNPFAGLNAFSGVNEASGGVGSWGTSRINLSSLPGVVPGANIQFRWIMAMNGCIGTDGWYIDDVRVYTCGTMQGPAPVATFDGNHTAKGPKLFPNPAESQLTIELPEAAPEALNIRVISATGAKYYSKSLCLERTARLRLIWANYRPGFTR